MGGIQGLWTPLRQRTEGRRCRSRKVGKERRAGSVLPLPPRGSRRPPAGGRGRSLRPVDTAAGGLEFVGRGDRPRARAAPRRPGRHVTEAEAGSPGRHAAGARRIRGRAGPCQRGLFARWRQHRSGVLKEAFAGKSRGPWAPCLRGPLVRIRGRSKISKSLCQGPPVPPSTLPPQRVMVTSSFGRLPSETLRPSEIFRPSADRRRKELDKWRMGPCWFETGELSALLTREEGPQGFR